MKCIISTPINSETYINLLSVTILVSSGVVQIKPGHAEYLANIVIGEVIYVTQSQKKPISIKVQAGVCRVMNDIITIVV